MAIYHSTLHLSMIVVLSSLIGCSAMPGFQTHDIPNNGTYQTGLGTSIEVVQITQDNLNHFIGKNSTSENQANLATLFQSKDQIYHLAAGDVLSVQLWAYPEITPTITTVSNNQTAQAIGYRIDQSGKISFPLIGSIKVAGKTVTQFNNELNNRLSKFLKHPDAVVRVISYESQPFSVVGSVAHAGQFYLNDQPVSVYAAIGLAGGLANDGNDAAIQLMRNGIIYDLNPIQLEKSGLSLQNLHIKANDTIYVNSKETQKIYVMGESNKPAAVSLRNTGMTLSDILGESTGINPNSASAKRIYVLRTDAKTQKTYIYHMNLTNLADFGLANQFTMRSNDIVYVDATGLTRWQRIINQIIPFSNALYNFNRLGN